MPSDPPRGRAATFNPDNRFEARRREREDDGWGSLDEPAPPLHTTLGIDSARWKLRVFVISALFAAAAGALTAHYAGFITPAKASFLHSVELVIMVVFGGMASIWGAVLGAAVLTVLPQVLTVLKDYEMMVFGAVLVTTMVFFPRGIVPTLARLASRK